MTGDISLFVDENLMANISAFLSYIAPGFILIQCMEFVAHKKKENEVTYLMFSSVALSYILAKCAILICSKISWFPVELCLVLLAVVVGCVLGRLYKCEKTDIVFNKLFHRTLTKNIFITLFEQSEKENKSIKVVGTLKNSCTSFSGVLKRVSGINENQMLVLAYYTVSNNNGDTQSTADHSDDVDESNFVIIPHSEIATLEYSFFSGE